MGRILNNDVCFIESGGSDCRKIYACACACIQELMFVPVQVLYGGNTIEVVSMRKKTFVFENRWTIIQYKYANNYRITLFTETINHRY